MSDSISVREFHPQRSMGIAYLLSPLAKNDPGLDNRLKVKSRTSDLMLIAEAKPK